MGIEGSENAQGSAPEKSLATQAIEDDPELHALAVQAQTAEQRGDKQMAESLTTELKKSFKKEERCNF